MTGARTTAALTQKTAFFFKTAPLGDTTTIDGGWQLTPRAGCIGVSIGEGLSMS